MFIKNTYHVPPLSNLTLTTPEDDIPLAELELRECKKLGFFIENKRFNSSLIIYDKNYQNSVANSPTFVSHMKKVAQILKDKFSLDAAILEVGCGKGDFLEVLANEGFTNLEGYDTAYEGDDPKISKRYLNLNDKKNADLIILRHTLEHISKPFDFLDMLRKINIKECDIYIEVPNLEWILSNSELNEISFEHVNYFTKNSLCRMFDNRVKQTGSLFGNQYIYVVANLANLSKDYKSIYENHINWKDLNIQELFKKYFDHIKHLSILSHGYESIILWGGAARATLFLHICKYNFIELFNKVKVIVDINPRRFGKYLPSSHKQIISPNEFILTIKSNDLLIITNPNYREEIEEYLSNNLKFKIKTVSLTNTDNITINI